MLIVPGVAIPEDHVLTRLGRRLRIWSKPSSDAGMLTAGVIVGLLWMPWGAACFLVFGDRSYLPFLAIAASDVGLRLWRVRSTILWIPISVWALLLLGVVLYSEHA